MKQQQSEVLWLKKLRCSGIKLNVHLSGSCISGNLMGNPNKCRSQLALILATLPVVPNSPSPRLLMCVCVSEQFNV